ncbi:MAG: SDR family oxidoreductase [Paracoccaceae bacterium]|jgi:NAD(P)-dependent dehydrogenase (short-subunit alcohol dehydrogenase family)|nr:SDR family oxidoreductase [Paracoccaceae bacterium]MDP7186574.1 SDR family oxidoreductase [Paracoccaceae bacterium]
MTVVTEKPVALITGASRGLGAALALALAPSHHIVAVARTTGALEELDDNIRALGGEATLAPMDICVEPAMAQLCRSIYDRWGKIALWAHTAIHAEPLTPASHIIWKDWDKSLEINAKAPGRLIPFIAPLLGDSGQALFFEDDKAGKKFFGYYGASKAAQISLAKSWQAETVSTGPKVHVLSPNPMPTAMRARFFPGEDRALLAGIHDEAKRLLAEIGL